MSNIKNVLKNNKSRIIVFLVLTLSLLISIFILWPLVKEMNNDEFTYKLEQFIESLGSLGLIVLFLLQVLQVVVAVLPGGPFEIVAGMLYGPWIGTSVLIIGGIFASFCIFKICKRYGRPFVTRFFKEKHLKEWSWLEDNKKLELITFIVYLIPGTPKDMLTYLLGTTKMTTGRFLLISNLGRIPALFISCGLGSSIGSGNYNHLLIYGCVLFLLTIFSFLFRDRIIGYMKEKRSK